ncbi:MAG: DUF565 domain-containing protein [Gloeomargaritaceae cyanobacterium C42_A2020_066]|nr:DUF565 domain-containing protein [Gloeomargaritaceae cyanobacterium C42_A2020_066]
MQDTRLNRVFGAVGGRFNQWLGNPWRTLSLGIIAFLLGFLLASTLSTVFGQQARLDVVTAGLTVIALETLNWLVHAPRLRLLAKPWPGLLNALRIGIIYGMVLEAFKLGS